MARTQRASAGGDPIRFVLDGEIRTVAGVAPTRSVLNFLREDLGRTGTKEGCAEGDCGACTVVVAERDGDRVRFRAVNSCIQFVPTLDGKALFTVESLKHADGTLHPAQQAMVDCHGSQCGFCTPGFVMSLWNVYVDHRRDGTRADARELRTRLSGNLCRCTGYRPILEAGERMFDLPPAAFDEVALARQLASIERTERLDYAHEGARFHAPRTLAELTELKAAKPEATILAGCTDIGLWVNKQMRELPEIVYVGEVAELKVIREDSRMAADRSRRRRSPTPMQQSCGTIRISAKCGSVSPRCRSAMPARSAATSPTAARSATRCPA